MPFIQNISPPPNDIRTFNITTFYGGLNNVDDYVEMSETESSDLLNIDFFSDKGTVQKRKGYEQYGTFEVVDEPIIFLDEYKKINADSELICATSTDLYIDEVQVKTLTGHIRGVNFNGKYLYVDGDELYSYGIHPQSSSGTYISVVGTPTGSAQSLKVVLPGTYTPLPSPHVIGVTVYNYTLGTVTYQPCQYEVDDTFKGGSILCDTPKYIELKDGRVYITGSTNDPHAVWISDVQNPYYFPFGVGVRLTPNGDEITCLREFHNAIIVGRKDDVHAIYGNTNRTDYDSVAFKVSKINTHTGIASDRTCLRIYDFVFYLGSDGNFYTLNTPQTDVELMQTRKINKKVNLKKSPLSIDDSLYSSAVSVFRDDLYYTSIGDKILVYSYIFQTWSVYDGFNARSFLYFDNELLFGADNGKIYKNGYGYNDDGVAIICYWQSKRYDMGFGSRVKKFKQMYFIAETYEDFKSGVSVDFEVDYALVEYDYDIKSEISKWGRAIFGDRFIKWNISKSLPLSINRRGRLIRFIFGNDVLDETFKIFEINGEFELRGYR